MFEEKEKSDFYYEYDLISARKNKSQLPEANHQKEAIKGMKKWFESKEYPSGTIIALPTGSGKTFTAVRFLTKHVLSNEYKVLWLAHTHHLLEQAYYSFGPANKEVRKGYEVGWIQEPKTQLNIRVVSGTPHHYNVNQIKETDDVVIATLQTASNAYKKAHPDFIEFIDSADGKLLVVFDEAHHAPAPTYRNLILSLRDNYPEMHVLGLTATPTHFDIKKRGWLREIFPQEIVSQAQVKDLMLEEILAEPYIEENGTRFTPQFDEQEFLKWREAGKKKIPEHIITQLASNRERNQFIADTYVQDKERYGKTIMFADRWHQCEQLSTFLQDQGIRADTMFTRTDNERNAVVLDRFRNNELDVVINIKMLTEGTDVPDVDTVFVTRQTTSPISITQMVGRALRGRRFGGTDKANLVFFYDDWQKTINWAEWDTETWTAKQIYDRGETEPKPLDKISIDAVKRLIEMMDRGDYVNPGPFLTFLPVGWYQITVSEIGDEGSPEEVNNVVMVFENEINDYIQFIEHLKNEHLDDFDSDFIKLKDHMPQIKEWCKSFFPSAEMSIGESIHKNIFDIARHMAQNLKEPPRFIKFEERKKHNLDVIAEKFIEKDYGARTVNEKLRNEYNRKDRYWKVIYYHYDLFKSQYNACVDYILSDIPDRLQTQEEIQVERLNNGTLDEKIKACEILGEMGGEDNLHEKTIDLLIKVSQKDRDSNVRKAAKKALEIINSLDLTPEEKQQIKERDGYVCLCCGENRKQYLQVDHVEPRWNKVDNSESNLQTLCKTCNITKSTETIDFRETVSPLTNPPTELPYLYRIKSATKEQLNNNKWLETFITRSINFFYQSQAVKNIDLNSDWNITLNKGNSSDWLTPHLKKLKDVIKEARKTHGYPGPTQIQIIEISEREFESEEIPTKTDEDEVLILIKTLRSSSDDRERQKASRKLKNIVDKRAVTVLIKSLDDNDPVIARNAARALKLNPDTRSIYPLIKKFNSNVENLRYDCKDAIISIGKEAVPDLLTALGRQDKKIREMAVDALGGIGDESTLDNIIKALNDKESSVRWRAANALGNFDNEKTIKPLKNALKDKTQIVPKYAKMSLKRKEDKIKNLFKQFDTELMKHDDEIRKNKIKSGFSYSSPQRVFLTTLLYNPHKVIFWTFIDNQNINDVKKHKNDPRWATYMAHNEKEFIRALEIIKKSLELMRLETGENLIEN